MNTENKNKYLVLTVIVLALMNIATLATVVYHHYRSKQIENTFLNNPPKQDVIAQKYSGRYFRDKLNLSPLQMEKFRIFNPDFRSQARNINLELAKLREQMLNELTKPIIDTVQLNSIADSVGILHSQLKKITCQYYLDLKSICDTSQQRQLEQLFRELLVADTPLSFPGRRGQGWHGGRNNAQ